MTICSEKEKEWSMCLVKCDPTPCPPKNSEPETFCFKEVKVANEIITGKVYTDPKDKKFVYLSGVCAPFDHQPDVSRMSFYFQAVNKDGDPVIILLNGWGYYKVESPNPIFVGGFVAVDPPKDTDAGSPPQDPIPGSALVVNFDAGDTGTGTGMQAQCPEKPQT